MSQDLMILTLFSMEIVGNLVVTIWVTAEISKLKTKVQENKKDIDELATLQRRNYSFFQGNLTRFISECATRFRNLNIDTNFTYPKD